MVAYKCIYIKSHLVPVGSARLGARGQSRDQVLLVPPVYDAERHLKPRPPDVSLGLGGRHVELDVNHFLYGPPLLKAHVNLFLFDLIQESHEPLETLLVAVDPDEIHLTNHQNMIKTV